VPQTFDFLIIGGGIVGLSIARELKSRHPAASIVVLEKERSSGEHASGRNSGVLHSGIYYTSDSLKANLTREGNRALLAYGEEKRIPVLRCGKLIVARSEKEHPALDELLCRAAANGVTVESVCQEEAGKIEPRAKTAGRALFVTSTSSVDPSAVMRALVDDCRTAGVQIHTSTRYLGRTSSNAIRTTAGEFAVGFLVNCGGLQADRIARGFGFSKNYRILPFKGLYLESDEPAGALRCHVYPVPAETNPFLGVHATVKADGRWKIGPTAIPAFWRENYQGLSRFDPGEFIEIVAREIGLLFGSDFEFRRLAWEELRKHSRKRIVALASELIDGVAPDRFTGWGRPGIRAQLVDIRERSLVSDFVLEGDDRSIHILNAVSPGFTCALPFARLVCGHIEASFAARATVSAID
jgi:L-2-hydroxyglutarate oxidase LhgO